MFLLGKLWEGDASVQTFWFPKPYSWSRWLILHLLVGSIHTGLFLDNVDAVFVSCSVRLRWGFSLMCLHFCSLCLIMLSDPQGFHTMTLISSFSLSAPPLIAVFDCLFWPLSENIFYIFQVFLVFSSLSLSLKPTPVLLSPQFSAPLLAFFSDTSITQCHYEMKLWFLKQLQWIKHLDSFLVSFFPLSVTSTMAALNKYEATVARLLWATAQTLQKTTSGLVYTWISTLFF